MVTLHVCLESGRVAVCKLEVELVVDGGAVSPDGFGGGDFEENAGMAATRNLERV